jgi:hypothetical protein
MQRRLCLSSLHAPWIRTSHPGSAHLLHLGLKLLIFDLFVRFLRSSLPVDGRSVILFIVRVLELVLACFDLAHELVVLEHHGAELGLAEALRGGRLQFEHTFSHGLQLGV